MTSILEELDESYVFSLLIEYMHTKTITIDDAKALLINHECRLEMRIVIITSLLPSINITVKNQANQRDQKVFNKFSSSLSTSVYPDQKFNNNNNS